MKIRITLLLSFEIKKMRKRVIKKTKCVWKDYHERTVVVWSYNVSINGKWSRHLPVYRPPRTLSWNSSISLNHPAPSYVLIKTSRNNSASASIKNVLYLLTLNSFFLYIKVLEGCGIVWVGSLGLKYWLICILWKLLLENIIMYYYFCVYNNVCFNESSSTVWY